MTLQLRLISHININITEYVFCCRTDL